MAPELSMHVGSFPSVHVAGAFPSPDNATIRLPRGEIVIFLGSFSPLATTCTPTTPPSGGPFREKWCQPKRSPDRWLPPGDATAGAAVAPMIPAARAAANRPRRT